MRSLLIAFVLFFAIGVSAAPSSPFLHIDKTTKSGKVELLVKNVSHKPVVAYVVIVESASNRSVFHGVYTDKDSLAAGKTAILGEVASKDQIKASVDYVRLADGTTWGPAATDDAKGNSVTLPLRNSPEAASLLLTGVIASLRFCFAFLGLNE